MRKYIKAVFNLTELAAQAMAAKDLLPTFSKEVHLELNAIKAPAACQPGLKDMRNKLWFSIDNDDSLDLDQLSYVEKAGHVLKAFVAIADVETLVKRNSPIDLHAQHNTTSVYTPTVIFPMLPEKLSNNFTSLNEGQDRKAIVVEMEIKDNGEIGHSSIYQACVHNHAKLTYNAIGAWIETKANPPEALAKNEELQEQILLHHTIAQKMSDYRVQKGMLSLETVEAKAIIKDHIVVDIVEVRKNPARLIIENFMIGANACVTKFLRDHDAPSFQRVVRTPEKWDRIVALATERSFKLPSEPDSKALEKFLIEQQKKDPERFPDLSLAVIKLLGRGEYVVHAPNQESIGHFGLALRNYSHSTAPNRRYPDLITQRLLKAVLNKQPLPYKLAALQDLAAHCSEKEADADRVARQMQKSAAAFLLEKEIGKTYEGFVTGANAKGTWVRIFHPPTEGKIVKGYQNLDVGDRVQVKLVDVDIPNGHIDFAVI